MSPVIRLIRLLTCAVGILCALADATPVWAQARAEVRGFWVDTFNTPLNTHTDVVTIVDRATAARANTIYAQVRRRGDAWYLDSLEPAPDNTPLAAGFDPLRDLIVEAHARGLEVQAFVIANAIWNRAPNLFPPSNPAHVFNRHSGYDAGTNTITPGADTWLTRTLLAEGTPGISLQGHRFGSEFYIDPGHPDAASYTADVLLHLVRNYDVDGLHLDRIRYPEISVAGQTPSTGTSVGYNQTNVARFQRHYGIPVDAPPPAPSDPRWSQWRRDQVTNLVRRIYLEAVAIRPQVKISAALIAFGSGPATESAWLSAEPYWRVYQDWRAWTEEGILDIAIPMIYQREHVATGRLAFDRWNDWVRTHQYARSTMLGLGPFLNSVEGTLRQTRRALAPAGAGAAHLGVNFFSMATSNVAVAANPLSIPPGQNTPVRPYADVAAGLVSGRSANGLTLFEDPAVYSAGVFAEPAAVPALAWKTDPQVGHLKGIVLDETAAVVDTGRILVERQDGEPAPAAGRTSVATATDGNGFYGGVDLAPGRFRVTVTPAGAAPYQAQCLVDVTRGQVSTLNINIDRAAPSGSLAVNSTGLWPPTGAMREVTLTAEFADVGTGLAHVTFRVIDEYGGAVPEVAPVVAHGEAMLIVSRTFAVEAKRLGRDRDGRTYTIEAVVTDRACNVTSLRTTFVVAHDQRR